MPPKTTLPTTTELAGGIFLLDKPSGPSSQQAISALKRAGLVRVGHAGTLDPFASGLLVVLSGRLSRAAEWMVGLDKEYQAVVDFSRSTDTDDRKGATLNASDAWALLSKEVLSSAISSSVGAQMQLPPAYSAIQVDGKRAYRAARAGTPLELSARAVNIHDARLIEWAAPLATVHYRVSSGTYVRAIARDLGQALGLPAHLKELRRTMIGALKVEDAVTLEQVMDNPSSVETGRISSASALGHVAHVEVGEDAVACLVRGVAASVDHQDGDLVLAFHDDRLIAAVKVDGGIARPLKVFADA